MGPLHFERVPLVDGDMAVAGRSIARADPEAVDLVLTTTAERLRALNWLRRGGPYSGVDDTRRPAVTSAWPAAGRGHQGERLLCQGRRIRKSGRPTGLPVAGRRAAW